MNRLIIKPFTQLSVNQLYDILALRSEVFVVGQQCLYQDCDYRDQLADHMMDYRNEHLTAYLRILPHSNDQAMSFGRVLTHPQARQKNYGKQIVAAAIDYIHQHYPGKPILISAQHYLIKFYQSFGFQTHGDVYEEDGIPHIRMEYALL